MDTVTEGFLYLLQSEKDAHFYYGSTTDINRRLAEHNRGKNISTRTGMPWKLISAIRLNSISEARRIEQKIKSHKQAMDLNSFLFLVEKYFQPTDKES